MCVRYNNIGGVIMDEDHTPGRCYACNKDTDVRWKNLYTIGSEGTWLCMICEMIVVNLLRKLSREATLARKKERVARIISTRNTS